MYLVEQGPSCAGSRKLHSQFIKSVGQNSGCLSCRREKGTDLAVERGRRSAFRPWQWEPGGGGAGLPGDEGSRVRAGEEGLPHTSALGGRRSRPVSGAGRGWGGREGGSEGGELPPKPPVGFSICSKQV